MRVFIDARPVPGGIQRSLDELVRRLRTQAAGLELVLYRAAGGRRAPVDLEPTRRSRIRQQLGDVKRILEDQVRLPRNARRTRADVFVSPNGLVPARLGCRSVVQCHDLWLVDRPETKRGGFVTAYERSTLVSALDRADRIVVPSQSVLEELRRRFPHLSAKVRHIYHPLPRLDSTQPPAQRPSARGSALPSPPFLLHVGTLEPRKNLEHLIEAQRSLWPRTGVPLILVGPSGWRQKALLETIEESVGTRWIGVVDEGTLDWLYRHAAMLVQVSWCEGFNYPMVEAMQRGTSLVLSKLPVHREIAGGCARFCDPADPVSISAAIEEVLDWDAQRQRMNGEAARQGLETLADDRLVDRWRGLFDELAPRAGTDPPSSAVSEA